MSFPGVLSFARRLRIDRQWEMRDAIRQCALIGGAWTSGWMMDPGSLGLMVAGLVAKKALEKVAERAGGAGWEALGRVSQRVRAWFAERGDAEGLRALDVVEAAPDSPRAQEALAGEVARAAKEEPHVAEELVGLVREVERAGDARLISFVNQVRDNARVGRIVQVSGDYHEHGSSGH
jgi:hypothetical protein